MQGSGELALPLSSVPSLAHGACEAAAAAAELEARSKEFGAETVSSNRSDATSEVQRDLSRCGRLRAELRACRKGWLVARKRCRDGLSFPKATAMQAEWCPPTGRGRNPSMQWDWKCKIAERCGSSSRSAQGSWTWKPRRESPRVSAAASKLSQKRWKRCTRRLAKLSGPQWLSVSDSKAQKPAADLEESKTLRSMVKDWWPCEPSHPSTGSR